MSTVVPKVTGTADQPGVDGSPATTGPEGHPVEAMQQRTPRMNVGIGSRSLAACDGGRDQ